MFYMTYGITVELDLFNRNFGIFFGFNIFGYVNTACRSISFKEKIYFRFTAFFSFNFKLCRKIRHRVFYTINQANCSFATLRCMNEAPVHAVIDSISQRFGRSPFKAVQIVKSVALIKGNLRIAGHGMFNIY